MLKEDIMETTSTLPAVTAAEGVWPVMILAHNEAEHIVACLDSVYAAEPGRKFEIFVLANGCTDNTEEIVEGYAKTHPGVNLVHINMPDKCNAWNVYIHDVIPTRAAAHTVYFFMDGDARACPRAFSELDRGLRDQEHALAASAVPFSGRSMKRDRTNMVAERELVANLYALSGKFVDDIRLKQVRLPVGFEGDDGLIGALVKWDLDPRQQWDDRRLVPCPNAGFTFESISWLRWRDWKTYWRRRIRYARRQYEFKLLGPRLKRQGITGMPVRISELYKDLNACRLQWSGVYTLFNWLALKEMTRSR
jgi:glycosyltransferase involved in cell wall biosynthesis